METAVFIVCALIIGVGSLGVVLARNPVHSALMLVMTLFGIAVLFISLQAEFLAAVQVIVYAGAIVVLFLFVIMLLGVDAAEDLSVEPIVGQRQVATAIGIATFALLVAFIVSTTDAATGARSVVAPVGPAATNIAEIGRVLFTDYVLAFEVTAILLTIAVVGAVVLARRPRADELIDDPAEERQGR